MKTKNKASRTYSTIVKSTLLLFIVLVFCVTPSISFAHILQSDGSIEAALHIEPNEIPIEKSKSSLMFEFKDEQGKFSLSKCTCTVTILEHEKILLRKQLTGGLNSQELSFTFPQKGAYAIEVIGKPSKNDTFQNFKLSYKVEVKEEESFNYALINLVCVLIGVSIMAFVVLFYLRVRGKTKKSITT